MAAASLDVDCKEDLKFEVLSEAERTLFTVFYDIMLKADPTALLSPAVGGSMQIEAKLPNMNLKSLGFISTMPGSPATRTFKTSTNPNCQSLAIGLDILFPISGYRLYRRQPNASDFYAGTRLEHRRARHLGQLLGQVAERDNSPMQEISIEPRSSHLQSSDFSGLSAAPLSTLCAPMAVPLPTGSPRRLPPTSTNSPPALQGHVHHDSSGSTAVSIGVTNIGAYADDGDLIHHAPSVGRVQSGFSREASDSAAWCAMPHILTPIGLFRAEQRR
ncbi:hypothetical protein EDB85DRAFT_2146239 [Lactarius pseudohatsudake]|nr:hypothetical protein EDB85DRAFT_2146239 [Lactarius pseudohatsudake]